MFSRKHKKKHRGNEAEDEESISSKASTYSAAASTYSAASSRKSRGRTRFGKKKKKDVKALLRVESGQPENNDAPQDAFPANNTTEGNVGIINTPPANVTTEGNVGNINTSSHHTSEQDEFSESNQKTPGAKDGQDVIDDESTSQRQLLEIAAAKEKMNHDAHEGYKIGLENCETDPEKAEECFEKALSARIELYGDKHSDTIEVRERLGDLKIQNGNFSVGVSHYRKALFIIYSNTTDKKDDNIVRIESKLAGVLFDLNYENGNEEGREEAFKLYSKVIPLMKKRRGINDQGMIRMLYNFGMLQSKKKLYKEALICFNELLEAKKSNELGNFPKELYSPLLLETAMLNSQLGELNMAEKYYKELLSHIKVSGEDGLYNAMYRLSCVLLKSNKFDESLQNLEKLLVAVEEGNAVGILDTDILGKLATVHMKLENYEEAIVINEKYRQCLEEAKSQNRRVSEEYVIEDVYANLGDLYKKMGQNYAAVSNYDKVILIQLYERGQPNQETLVRTYNNIAICCFKEEMYDRALGACEDSLEKNSTETVELLMEKINTYKIMGSIYKKRADFVNSTKYYELSNELHEQILGGDKKSLCVTLTDLGIVSQKAFKLKEAHTFFNKALELQLSLNGGRADSLEVAKIHTQIGKVYMKEKKYAEALSAYKLAYETEKVAATDYATASTVSKIGSLYLKLNDVKHAITFLEKGLTLKKEMRIEVGNLPFLLCVAYISTNDLDTAFKYARDAWKLDKVKNGEYHEHTLISRGMVARIKSLKGENEEALSDYEDILNIKRNQMRAICSDESEAISVMDIGYVYLRMGKYSRARDKFNEAKNLLLQTYGDNDNGHPSNELLKKYFEDLNQERKKHMFHYYVDKVFN